MVFGKWSLPVLISTHEPFAIFSLPCPAEEWQRGFGVCLASRQGQTTIILLLLQKAEEQNGLLKGTNGPKRQAFMPNSSQFHPVLLSLFVTHLLPCHLLPASKKAKPQLLSRSQEERVLKLWTQGPLLLQHVWIWWAQQQTLKCKKKGHRWFSFKIYVQTESIKFPSGLICWDFNMYPELSGLSPDNDFLVIRTRNPKNAVLQILKHSWWFFKLRVWFIQSFTSSWIFNWCTLFLEVRLLCHRAETCDVLQLEALRSSFLSPFHWFTVSHNAKKSI